MQSQAFWEILLFLLNAVLFVLVGLQLPSILDNISGPTADLVKWAALVSGAVIAVRLVWGFTVVYVVRALDRAISPHARRARAGERFIGSWAGIRGVVSLAAALALPLHTDAGAAFPQRDLIIFLTYAVLLVTLVGQGLTLGPLIKLLRVEDDDSEEHEELLARKRTAQAALARLTELESEDWVRDETAERVRALFDYRLNRFRARAQGDGALEERADAYRRLMYQLFDAQREALLQLRSGGEISEEVRRRVERELDLDESRIGGF
jgi:CPA1 family monovalent cation:H+ antiporter